MNPALIKGRRVGRRQSSSSSLPPHTSSSTLTEDLSEVPPPSHFKKGSADSGNTTNRFATSVIRSAGSCTTNMPPGSLILPGRRSVDGASLRPSSLSPPQQEVKRPAPKGIAISILNKSTMMDYSNGYMYRNKQNQEVCIP